MGLISTHLLAGVCTPSLTIMEKKMKKKKISPERDALNWPEHLETWQHQILVKEECVDMDTIPSFEEND